MKGYLDDAGNHASQLSQQGRAAASSQTQGSSGSGWGSCSSGSRDPPASTAKSSSWKAPRAKRGVLAFEDDEPLFFDGNFSEYELDRVARLGDTPKGQKYRKLEKS